MEFHRSSSNKYRVLLNTAHFQSTADIQTIVIIRRLSLPIKLSFIFLFFSLSITQGLVFKREALSLAVHSAIVWLLNGHVIFMAQKFYIGFRRIYRHFTWSELKNTFERRIQTRNINYMQWICSAHHFTFFSLSLSSICALPFYAWIYLFLFSLKHMWDCGVWCTLYTEMQIKVRMQDAKKEARKYWGKSEMNQKSAYKYSQSTCSIFTDMIFLLLFYCTSEQANERSHKNILEERVSDWVTHYLRTTKSTVVLISVVLVCFSWFSCSIYLFISPPPPHSIRSN